MRVRLALLIMLAWASSANAYEEQIHALLDERALPDELLGMPLVRATTSDVDALRHAIWQAGQTHSDATVRSRFLARYPTEDGFDDWAFKEFLGLNADATVMGIDVVPPLELTVRAVITAGARYPDADKRNQERFSHDEARKIRLDPYGNPLPADPLQLDMGSLRGTPSQAYAHYGLPKVDFSDDADVLKKEPRRFLYPPTTRAFAADFAQEFTDLAICAATLKTDGGAFLGWLFLGNAHHYLEDVANQIHTLQAVYGFFYDAKIESYKEELFSLGGLLRARPDFVTIGIGIIKNHHLLIENLWAKRVFEAVSGARGPHEVQDGLAAIARGDGALEQAFDARQIGIDGEFARVLTDEVIEASSHEGGEVYDLARQFALPSLSKIGGDYDGDADPDAFVRKNVDPAVLTRFYHLESAGFARAGSALRRHVRLYLALLDRAQASDEARHAQLTRSAERLITSQLALLDEREARLAAWQPKPPLVSKINWLVPGGLLVVLLVVIGGPALLIRWIRRRRRRALATG